jgi:hypothetical protein
VKSDRYSIMFPKGEDYRIVISLHCRPESVDPEVYAWGIQVQCNTDELDLPNEIPDDEPVIGVIETQQDVIPTAEQIAHCHKELITCLHCTLFSLAELGADLPAHEKARVCLFFFDKFEQSSLEFILLAAAVGDDDELRELAKAVSLTIVQGGCAIRLNSAADTMGTGLTVSSIEHSDFTSLNCFSNMSAAQVDVLAQPRMNAFTQRCPQELCAANPSFRIAGGRGCSIDCLKKILILNSKRVALGMALHASKENVEEVWQERVKAEADAVYMNKCQLLRPRCALIKEAVMKHMVLSFAGYYEFEDIARCLASSDDKAQTKVRAKTANMERIFERWSMAHHQQVRP